MSTTTETPPTGDGAKRTEAATAKIGILLVALLTVLALAVVLVQGSKSSSSSVEPLAYSPPTQVTVPSIAVSSSLIPLGLDPAGALAVPPLSKPMQASWFDKSPAPGMVGPAVVLGHINGNGKPGVFANLDKVQAGAEIEIARQDGMTAVFTVQHVDTVPKNAFPTDSVYGDTAGPELRLITCGGDLDRAARSYKSNVVVFATMTSSHRT